MLSIAFITLAVLAVLFGSCIYIYIKINPGADNPPAPDASLPKKENTRTFSVSVEEDPETDIKPKTSAPTDAELLSMQAVEIPAETDGSNDSERRINPMPIIIGAIAALILLCAVAAIMVYREANKHSFNEVQAPKTITATVDNIRRQTKLNGKIVCSAPETAVFAANGKITDVKLSEGDYVKQGAEIYVLDSSIVNERISILNKKIEVLSEEQHVSVSDNTSVKASADGRIVKLFVSKGDNVKENDAIAEISQSSQCSVTLPFAAEDVDTVKSGSKAVIYSDTEEFAAVVTAVGKAGEDAAVEITLSFTADTAPSAAEGKIGRAVSLGSGRVTSKGGEHIVIYSETEGKITRVNVKNGDAIKLGGVIALISRESKSGEAEERELEIQELKLELKELEDSLKNYSVTAPVSGYVERLYFKNGATAAVGVQAVSIVPEGGLSLEVAMDKEISDSLSLPAAADFTVIKTSDFPSEVWNKLDESMRFSGIIEAVAPSEDSPAKTVSHIKLENQSLFRSGMIAEVNVTTYSKFDAILIPAELVNNGSVKVWQANKTVEVPVETGITTDDGYVEIISGINSVDKIVAE